MRSHLVASVAFLLLAAGCASSSDVKRLSDQITDLQDQIADLKRQVSSKEEVQRLNERIAQQTQSLLKSNADLTVKVNEMDDRLQNAQGSIEQTNYRIDRIVQQITQSQRDIDSLKMSAGGSPAAGGPIRDEVTVQPPLAVAEDPIQIYQTAYRDYQRGNFDLAIQGFAEFVRGNPNSDLADNAAYWIGESLFSQKKYRDAIEQFDLVVNQYPRSDKVPGALLKKGYSYIEIGQKAQGVVQLQYVIHEHPRSQEATLARQKLRELGIETR
ncbi:MAG TPA: tol-pal system protein YbgF [Thermoanaerobaculia bacterium]|nr:tol-pal system protein YbgF [Thermoanaerobaculia bacterium]